MRVSSLTIQSNKNRYSTQQNKQTSKRDINFKKVENLLKRDSLFNDLKLLKNNGAYTGFSLDGLKILASKIAADAEKIEKHYEDGPLNMRIYAKATDATSGVKPSLNLRAEIYSVDNNIQPRSVISQPSDCISPLSEFVNESVARVLE